MKIGTGIIEIGIIETDAAINVAEGRTEEFKAYAKTLSDYIKELPLDHKQNDELVAMVIKHIRMGEIDAFKYGLKIGFDFGKSFGQCV